MLAESSSSYPCALAGLGARLSSCLTPLSETHHTHGSEVRRGEQPAWQEDLEHARTRGAGQTSRRRDVTRVRVCAHSSRVVRRSTRPPVRWRLTVTGAAVVLWLAQQPQARGEASTSAHRLGVCLPVSQVRRMQPPCLNHLYEVSLPTLRSLARAVQSSSGVQRRRGR